MPPTALTEPTGAVLSKINWLWRSEVDRTPAYTDVRMLEWVLLLVKDLGLQPFPATITWSYHVYAKEFP